MICENCGKYHDGSYGSGRFCSASCRASFTNRTRGKRLKETKIKISKSLTKEKPIRYCKFCGKLIENNSNNYCSDTCRKINQYKIPTLIKYFGYDKSLIGTNKAYSEFYRIKNLLYDLYWNQHMSSSEIATMFKYTSHVENLTNKVFVMLGIPKKTLSQSQTENLKYGRTNIPSAFTYKASYHTTWNNKIVYLRSSNELVFAKELDDSKIEYEVENLRISYFDTILNKERIAIPDFYLPATNTLVEIKSTYTLDIQNMKDKFKAYNKLGYNTRLIVDFKDVDINNLLG